MNFAEANPQNESYWWVKDDDDDPTIVAIDIIGDKVYALFIGNTHAFDATELDYIGKASTLLPAKQAASYNFSELDEDLPDVLKYSDNQEGAKILNEVMTNNLNQEKLELADAILRLLPGKFTVSERIKMLEDSIGYTPKHVLSGESLDDVDPKAE